MRRLVDEPGSQVHLRIRMLGGFDVSVDGRAVPQAVWRQRRAATIVKLLALEGTHRLHREQLMDALWPDFTPAAQANNLRQMLHYTRKHLESAGLPRALVLQREGDAVILAPPNIVWVDVLAFERAVLQAWQTPAREIAQEAIALYAGDLLPDDRYDEWAEQRRMTLRASYLALLERLGTFHAERGDWSEAVAAFQRLIAAEPLRESAYVALMHLYALAGLYELALVQYDQLVTTLALEVGVDPEAGTRELAAAIGTRMSTTARLPGEAGLASLLPSSSADSLPSPVGRLIGREREIDEVCQFMATGRLVTLTGVGGIGKTRLAIAVAHAMSSAFPDGAHFVDLAPIRDPALLISAIGQTLEVRETSARPLLANLLTFLRDKRLLLVLDNMEHLIDAAPIISRLLEQAPQLHVLATSRMRLRLHGERQYVVPALAVPDPASQPSERVLVQHAATMLLIERAREVAHDFSPTGEDASAVAEICRRLDGLPLAIELAAARIAMLSPRALLRRLDHQLTLLTGAGRDLPTRQRTLMSTIQWSYDLLDPQEQHVFRQLSIFAGGWDLEAAEAVVTMNDGVAITLLEWLESLIDKNLITRRVKEDGEIRFGMLEMIREFGSARLAGAGDAATVCHRHATYFAELVEQVAEQLELADQGAWLDRLDSEYGNVQAALDWAGKHPAADIGLRLVRALRLYWFMRGRLMEGYEQAHAFTRLPESSAFAHLYADALNTAGFLAREYGDYERAYEASRESLEVSDGLHDRQRAANARANLGYVALQRRQYDAARDLFQCSLSTNRELDNQQGIADSLSFLALTAFYEGDLHTARRLNEESLAIWTALDDRQAIVWARTRLGAVLIRHREYPAAYDEFMTSLTICTDLDFQWGLSWAFDGLAHLATIHDLLDLAVHLVAAAEWTREVAGVHLAPLEKAELDELLGHLSVAIGTEAFDTIWSQRDRQSLGDLIRAASGLHDVLDASSNPGSSRRQTFRSAGCSPRVPDRFR